MWRQYLQSAISIFRLTLQSLELLVQSRGDHDVGALSGAPLQLVSLAPDSEKCYYKFESNKVKLSNYCTK